VTWKERDNCDNNREEGEVQEYPKRMHPHRRRRSRWDEDKKKKKTHKELKGIKGSTSGTNERELKGEGR